MAEVKSISEIISEISPYYKDVKKGAPECEHKLVYDSSSDLIEQVYFFILDLMNDFGLAPQKYVDTFTSTPGGQHFSEIGMKVTRLQDEASKLMGNVSTVLRSVLNLVYDLKDFKMRLQQYDDLNSDNPHTSEAAMYALKQIWLDKVDISRGNSSIKGMALGGAGFQTLIDAFLVAKDESLKDKNGNELDLNERVKRILKPRLREFQTWLVESEKELRKRYKIEKTYLKSQVSSLKLYSRWAKPYLRAIQQMEMKNQPREASLVSVFNTLRLELTIMGKHSIDTAASAIAGDLPKDLAKMKDKLRNYNSCVLVDFEFRAIPRQGGAFTGKTTATFKGYALTDEELKKLNQEIDKSDLGDVLQLIEGATTESLDQLKDEIEEFLKEDEELEEEDKDKEKEEKKNKQGDNPFLALIGHYNKSSKKKDKKKDEGKKDKEDEEIGDIEKDNWIEATHLRPLAAGNASETAFKLFDIYKKAHGMASFT